MKFDVKSATASVLIFAGVQRVIEVITNYFIKPNIPDRIDPQERDAIRLVVEILAISLLILIIKKFC